MKTYYLYFDNFSFSDSFSSNAIFCEKIMPNKKGTRTLSRITNSFLFITHKKLNSRLREQGITDALTNWPVTLELSYDSSKYSEFPVVFVKRDQENLVYEKGDLSKYNEDIHVGAYVYMEIPFTMVSHIYFENEEQLMDSDKSIFPDFLWRGDIISVINNEVFVDEIELPNDNEKLEVFTSCDMEKNICLVNSLNKYRAAILQFVNGSKEWIIDKHSSTFDKKLLDFFDISIDDVKIFLEIKNFAYNPAVLSSSSEPLEIIPTNTTLGLTEQRIYNSFVDAFISNTEKCTPAIVHQLLSRIKENLSSFIQEQDFNEVVLTLDSIEGCYLNNVGFSLDSTLERIENIYGKESVFKALFFVVKNPSDYEKFVSSLSVYKVDALTARRSMVLWGFLNGLRGIPALGFHRENLILWENIDAKVSKLINVDLYYKFNNLLANENKTCGILIESKEIITFDEVYSFLVSNKSLTERFIKDVHTVAQSCDKKLLKNDPYKKFSYSEKDVLELRSIIEKGANKLYSKSEFDLIDKTFLKKYKEMISKSKKNPVYDYEAIYKDWILERERFIKVWNLIEDKIKLFYISQRGKNE